MLTILALIGGLTHVPDNYDYLTYRFPRVLTWSWDQAWSWIPTIDRRINYSGTGFEWLMVPLFIVLKTDRLFFLVNFLSYVLLPGLIFSVFNRLGISRRISWWWMWVFPCGYCYILQAGSTGNDSFAVIYLMASLHFLYEARASRVTRNLLLSCIAISLVTGAKASNLPLVLPWAILLFFQRKIFLGKVRRGFIAPIALVSVAVSFLPMALLNIHFTGDFAGDPKNLGRMKLSNPAIGVLGNALQMAKDNLAPPILPHPIDWSPLVPAFLRAPLAQDFPRMTLITEELQIEEDAGVGLGVVLFAGLFFFQGIEARIRQRDLIVAASNQAKWVVGAGAIALLAYMMKMGSEATSRLVAAYYPLVIAGSLVFASLDGRVVGRRVFRWVGLTAMLSAVPLIILCPARPLFPVHTLSTIMADLHVRADIRARYDEVYRVYAARADEFKDFIGPIPVGERIIGLVRGGDDSEVSFWRPFGVREVVEVTPDDSIESLKARGIVFVAVSQDGLIPKYKTNTLNLLLAKWSCTLVAQKDIILIVHRGPQTWYLLRL